VAPIAASIDASFVSGEVTAVNVALGTATVGGFTVDYTPLMSNGFTPVIGAYMDVAGYGIVDRLVALLEVPVDGLIQ
ncbi:MAG: hypothetical protein AAGJ86_13830, partial [Pseudomonadota bacterium]